jgi:hypothetical protein
MKEIFDNRNTIPEVYEERCAWKLLPARLH